MGDTLRTGAVTVVAVPDTLTDALPPSLVILMVPLFAPAGATGANVTLNVALPPAAIDGIVAGENLNSALEEEMLLTLRGPVPVFDIVTVCAAEVVPIV